jgi:phosphonatase-like hydrolase
MNIKLAVFDIAGTTMDDKEDSVAHAFQQVIQENGLKIENQDIRWVMGYRKIEAIRMLMDHYDMKIPDTEIIRIHNRFIEILNDYYRTEPINEFEGISSLFKSLKQNNIKVSINTGFSRSTTDIILSRLGWVKNELVDFSIASDEVEYGRPHPDMIEKIMAHFSIQSSKSVAKIGDTPSDLLEGKNADCGLTIGVLYGTHTQSELEKYPHDSLVESVSDLKNLLLN